MPSFFMKSSQVAFNLIVLFSGFSSIIPFLAAIKNLRYLKKHLFVYFIIVLISLITELLNIILAKAGQSNLNFFRYYTIVEFLLISVFYITLFKSYFKPNLLYLIAILFLIISYLDYLFNGLMSMDNISSAIEAIIFIIYSLFFFYYVLKNLIFENIFLEPVFWINIAVLIYFSGNLILFVFSNYMAKIEPSNYIILWGFIHTFFNVLYSVLLSIGFWKAKSN